MRIIDYPDRELAAVGLADKLASALRLALQNEERVTIAVPGGTTPGPVFDILSGTDLDWARVTVLLTDERYVPEDHDRSNARLIRERLLQGPAAAARFIPFFREGVAAEGAAAQLSQELAGDLPLALVLLGMGADMHTASLFPQAKGLPEALASDAPALCVLTPADQPETRLTLSAPVLDAAGAKHLVIFGEDKRTALEKAMRLPPEQAPVAAVMTEGTVHWAP